MTTIITEKMRQSQALAFKSNFKLDSDVKTYLAIGKADAWDNEDDEPIVPSDSAGQEYYDYIDIYAMKRISQSSAISVIRRINWEANKVFQQYDNNVLDFYNTDFYCVNSNFHVFKCLCNNNGSPSLVEPTGTSSKTIVTSDGYAWKFMYIVPTTYYNFITNLWVPVREKLETDDQSDSYQWQVQLAAIDGAIEQINVVDGGSGYSGNVTVDITGDGTGCTAEAVVQSGKIVRINVTNVGKNYNYATVTIVGNGTNAKCEAVISPIGGHGSDALAELGGHYLLLNTSLEYGESGKIPVDNDYRKILLMTNPKLWDSNVYAEGDVYDCTYHFQLNNISGIENDTVIEGVNSGTTAVVVKVDKTNNTIWITSVKGAFAVDENIKIKGTEDVYTVVSKEPPQIEPRTGNIILKEYRLKVSRANDQTEEISICLEF